VSAVRRIFHLTAVVPDRDATVGALQRLAGASVLHQVTDVTNGVEMHRALVWVGDTVLEVLEPIGPSPFQGFLDRIGGGLSAIGVEVHDAPATRAALVARGVDVAVDFGPRMFATRPASTAGLAFQWSGDPVRDDPRDGATAPAPRADRVLSPARLAATVAVVDDPAAAGALLAELFGTSCTPLGDGPVVGVGLGDGTLVLHPLDDPAPPWPDPAPSRPRVLALAVEVADVDASVAALERAGLRVSGRHLLGPVLHGDGLPGPLVLASGLPAGDPRAGR